MESVHLSVIQSTIARIYLCLFITNGFKDTSDFKKIRFATIRMDFIVMQELSYSYIYE